MAEDMVQTTPRASSLEAMMAAIIRGACGAPLLYARNLGSARRQPALSCEHPCFRRFICWGKTLGEIIVYHIIVPLSSVSPLLSATRLPTWRILIVALLWILYITSYESRVSIEAQIILAFGVP